MKALLKVGVILSLNVLLASFAHAGVNLWTATGPTGRSVTALVVDPKNPVTLYVGTEEGIFKSIDSAASWQPKNNGLPGTSINAVAIDPLSPANIYVATEVGIFRSRTAGETWEATNITTPVGEIVIAPSAPQVIYARESNQLYVSRDGGGNWLLLSTRPGRYVTALAVAPTDAETVYASVVVDVGGIAGPIGAVYQTTNGGRTWNQLSADRFTSITPGALVVDPRHATTLFLATSDGVYKSEDGGEQWKPTGLPLSTFDLIIDPRDSALLYAGTQSGVFQSTDGGVRWVSLNKGFADFQTTVVSALAVDPQSGVTLYAAVNEGGEAEPLGRGLFAFQSSGPQPPAIFTTFESPEDGQAISGMTVLRGWAFATQPDDLIRSVDVYTLNGNVEGRALCCSERKDVHDAFPQFPATNTMNSGWGTVFNSGTLALSRQTIRVGIRTSADELLFTEPHTVQVMTPGGFQFLDAFDLATATIRLEQGEVILDGVVVRDKHTQQQKRVNTRFRWVTNLQALSMVQAETVATLARWRSNFLRMFTAVGSRMWRRVEVVAPVQAASGITSNWESPNEGQAVAGIGILRGWAFTEEPPFNPQRPIASIQDVTVQVDGAPVAEVLCCAERGDVLLGFPGQGNALSSGWALQFNYGVLSAGSHTISVQLRPTSANVPSQTFQRTIHAVRIGGFPFIDQFDLTNASARLEGEEIILGGVLVRDKASQQTKVIEVRLRWFQHSQALGIVASSS